MPPHGQSRIHRQEVWEGSRAVSRNLQDVLVEAEGVQPVHYLSPLGSPRE